MKRTLLLGSILLSTVPALAYDARMDAATVAHALDRLETTGRVLYIAAHPDDENTRLLAYLANAKHLTVAYLSMTRGGGGQNLVGPEQGDLLDVVRTEELLAARKLDGAQQRFTRARDFGYSKSASETLATWGHDAALADVVWTIRRFQPDVIITRFDERPPNHGHHTASAILAREGFVAAADPTRFPEQFKRGAQVWQADRLLHNLSPWRNEVVPPHAIELDVGSYDARLGLSYGELAALSRSQHKSQGFGVAGERGALVERFVWVAGSKPKDNILSGVTLDWQRFGEVGKQLSKHLIDARFALERDNPEWALPQLIKAHKAFEQLPQANPRVAEAKQNLDHIITQALGLFVRATAASATASPNSVAKIKLEVVQRRPGDVRLQSLRLGDGAAEAINKDLQLDQKVELARDVQIPADAPLSVPYFLVPQSESNDAAKSTSALVARLEFVVLRRTVSLAVPVVHSFTDRVHGERIRDFVIAPPATVTPLRDAVLSVNSKSTRVSLRVRTVDNGLEGTVTLPAPEDWSISPKSFSVSLKSAGDEAVVHFDATPKPNAKATTLVPTLQVGEQRFSIKEAVIDYEHIPTTLVLQPAHVKISVVEARIPKGLVGYIQGSGDSLPKDLAHLGVHVEVLDERALANNDLARFAAIVVGIRAYNTSATLRSAHPRLMRYVEKGGTVVVQYNTHSKQSPLAANIGPYPFELGRGRITHEQAAMQFKNPKHELLTSPHRIDAKDFEGWVQERGLYYADTWDKRFETLLIAQDPDESPLEGGVLFARVGRGRYIYTGLSFFRQLPAGVPGAYRLLLNFIGGN